MLNKDYRQGFVDESRNKAFYTDVLRVFNHWGAEDDSRGLEYVMTELVPLYAVQYNRRQALSIVKWCRNRSMSTDIKHTELHEYIDTTYENMMIILKQYVINFYNGYIGGEYEIPKGANVFQYILRSLIYYLEDRLYLRHLRVDRSERPNYLYITYLTCKLSKSASFNVKDPSVDFMSYVYTTYIKPLTKMIIQDEDIKKILDENKSNAINSVFISIFYEGDGISPLRLDAFNRSKLSLDRKNGIINYLGEGKNFKYATNIQKEHKGCISYKGEFKVELLDESIELDDKDKVVFEKNIGITKDWKTAKISDKMLEFFRDFCRDSDGKCDEERLTYLRQLIKMCIYGTANILQKWIIFLGEGNNGKSVMGGILGALLGDFHRQILPNNLEVAAKGSQTNVSNSFIAQLEGARLVICEELPDNLNLNVNLIKTFTGDQKIVAKDIYKTATMFKCEFVLVTITNYLDVPAEFVNSTSGQRRLAVFPAFYDVPESKKDPNLKNKLTTLEELNGLANWAINNGQKYDEVLPLPASMIHRNEEVTQEKIEQSINTNFKTWLENCPPPDPCSSMEDFLDRYSCSEVYQEYCKYDKKMTTSAFAANLKMIGREKKKIVAHKYVKDKDTGLFKKNEKGEYITEKVPQTNIYARKNK